MKRLLLFTAVTVVVVGFAISTARGELSRTAEFFLYDAGPENSGRTDFFAGGAKDWGVENRIDYLKKYGAFLKWYYGGLKLDEYATYPDEVEKTIGGLKQGPSPRVRREIRIERWRWTLSDEGAAAGWTARDFDDSGWTAAETTPIIVRGEETRDLWLRAAVTTDNYEKALLDFESVLGQGEIWVNGAKVSGPDALHDDSAPFRVDLTTWLQKNSENRITIHVRDHKQRGESSSPDEPSKYIGWGILGDVTLIETGAAVIDNAFVYTKQLSPDAATLKLQFTVKNYRTVQFDGTARIEVKKWFPEESGTMNVVEFPVSVLAGSGTGSPEYYALDFGTADSPVAPGFDRVTESTAFDAAKGYGWEKTDGLKSFDRADVAHVAPAGADLKRDGVEGGRPAAFRLATSPGLWAFEFTMGSADHPVETKIKYIDKYIVEFSRCGFREWEFAPVNATVYVRGGAAALRFEPPEKGKTFTINALTATNRIPWTQRFEKSIQLPKPEPWLPESPNLYELRITLVDSDGRAVDDTAATFGVVTLEDRDGELFVDGRRYRLRGVLETHSFPPERDDDLRCIAPPDQWIVQDILDNKKANVNVMRFHPAEGLGTNYSRWLDYADQLGMFVIWAPRQWFHWGNRPAEEFSPLLDTNLAPSMVRTRNHASIFAWEGGNETYYNAEIWDDRARKFSDEFYYLANSLDPSRFILPISFWFAQFEGKADFYRIDPNRGNELTWPGSGRSPLSFWAPNVFWDVHPYPGWYGSWAEIWWGAGKGDTYKKDKVFFVSEFGAEGMPNWELYKTERYYHTWENSASSAAKHEKNRLGRNLEYDEWEISQAYQALVIHNDITVYRTEDADGLAICTGAEGRHNGRYFKGIRDMHRRPKLAYYTTRTAYSPLFVEGLNGDTILSSTDFLEPVIVNDGPAVNVNIEVIFRDMSGKIVDRQSVKNIKLPETANLRPGIKIKPENLVSGNYYSVEYFVSVAQL